MADYNSGLPVRSEADVDERLQSKLVDFTTPSQGMEVDTDGNAHAEMHGNNPAGNDVVVRLSELGAPNPDGDYDATNNSKPASSALIAHDRNASPGEAQQNKRVTAVAGSNDTVCLDVAIRDESGAAFSESNPLPVSIAESEGTEVLSYATSSAVASDASVNHDYTVTALKTLIGKQVWVAGSGKLKMEVQIETAPAAGTYATKFVGFNSTASTNIEVPLLSILKQVAGAIVRIKLTNLENQAQDVYSTLSAVEV